MTATVRQTDCRTGWQVIGANGRPIATYRQKCHADAHARSLRPAPDYDPHIDYPERYTDGRPI